MRYAFILGREPALSTAEILAALQGRGIAYDKQASVFAPDFLILELDKAFPEFFAELGGSVKLAEIVKETDAPEDDLFEALKGLERKSLDFGVSFYGSPNNKDASRNDNVRKLPLEVKSRLKEADISARAVLPRKGDALSSVQVDKNGLAGDKGAEFLLLQGGGQTFLARTLAVQDYEDFSKRDYGRPGRDAKSGMLPPKLARMMLNLAAVDKEAQLLDPFCGSGTVLTEAVLMGYQHLLGTDESEKAVEDTKKNYTWTIKEHGIRGVRFKALRTDVRELSGKTERDSVDAIVTEPFLGPPLRGRESDQQIHRNFLELMGLYKGAFDAFSRVLKPGGTVVIAFPVFGKKKHVNILKDLREMGFKPEGLLPGKAQEAMNAPSATGLLYRRPGQLVGREIFRFRYQG